MDPIQTPHLFVLLDGRLELPKRVPQVRHHGVLPQLWRVRLRRFAARALTVGDVPLQRGETSLENFQPLQFHEQPIDGPIKINAQESSARCTRLCAASPCTNSIFRAHSRLKRIDVYACVRVCVASITSDKFNVVRR